MNTDVRKTGVGVTIAVMALLGVVVSSSAAGGPPEGKLPDKAARRHRYLLLDSRVIESVKHARLTIGAVRKDKNNPLFKEDKPWEPYISNLYGRIIYDEKDKLYKCWYSMFIISSMESNTPRHKRSFVNWKESRGRRGGVCYATSKDGIRWEKPELGIIDFRGSKKNNIVLRAPHGVGVMKDLRETDPQRRYKAILPGRGSTRVWFSPDGLHWKEKKLPGLDHGDTYNCVFWDPSLGKYVLITRHWGGSGAKGKRYGRGRYRMASRSDSPDFLNWSKAQVVLEGPDTNKQIHDMIVFRHAGVYIGLVGLWDMVSDREHVELAWSADSIKWHWIEPGKALIPNSRHIGDYDWGCIFSTPPLFTKDRILIYYGANDNRFFGWRDAFLCRATLRPDGFAGYEDFPGGTDIVASIRTKPLVAVSGSLRLSADVVLSGYVKVICLDEKNAKLAESELVAKTASDAPVRWKEGFSLEKLKGRRIKLQFELRDAKLYSFSFRK